MTMDESHHKELFSKVEAINTYCQTMLDSYCSILEILAEATKKLNKAHKSFGYPLDYWEGVGTICGLERLCPILAEINKETIFTYSPDEEISLNGWPPIMCCINSIDITDLSVKLYDITNHMLSQNRYSISAIAWTELCMVRLSQVDSLEYKNNEKLHLW